MLAMSTIQLVMYVFVLYVVWDLLGIWITKVQTPAGPDGRRKPKYPALKDEKPTDEPQVPDWAGLLISGSSLLAFVVLWLIVDCASPIWLLFAATALLLVYRWAKEVRTSWRALQRSN